LESHHVILLTEGYLRGWLDFEDKTPFSSLRESYILHQVERNCLLDVIKVKIFRDSVLATIPGNTQAIQPLMDLYGSFLDLALPSASSKSTIESKQLSADSIKELKELLIESKKKAKNGNR